MTLRYINMQYPLAECSTSKKGADSAQATNEYVQRAGTSQEYRKTNGCQVEQQPRVSHGFRRSERWCFRTCRRARDVRRHCGSQLLPTESNLAESSSTQTWEPWNRNTCLTKFLQLKKLNQTVIRPNRECFLTPENQPNDNYNRLSELKCPSNDRGKSVEARSSTTTCKHDGCGVCKAMRDRVFAEMALQTDVTSYKIITCGTTTDQPQNFNLDKNLSKVTPKSRLHPRLSSSEITKETNKTDKKPVKKKTSVNLHAKKSAVVEKRNTPKAVKKIAKKISTSSNLRAKKFPGGKKSRVTRKKSRTGRTNEEGIASNRVTATAPLPAVNIFKEDNATETETDLIEIRDKDVDKVVAEEEMHDDHQHEPFETIVKVENVTREYPERRISILNEAFEVKRSLRDKVSTNKSENEEVDGSETATACSSKCQGVLLQRRDYVKLPISSSWSSRKQLENGSTTPEKVENMRRKSVYRVKKKSTLKNPKAHSSTSNSIEPDDLCPPMRKNKLKRSLVPGAKSTEKKVQKPGKAIIQKIRKDKSSTITSEIPSADESRGKSDTTIRHVDEDQSPSFDYEKFNSRKSTRQSSAMTIWHWLRERYRNTSTKASLSFESTDRVVEDPFLSLFFPMMETQKYQNLQVNET